MLGLGRCLLSWQDRARASKHTELPGILTGTCDKQNCDKIIYKGLKHFDLGNAGSVKS